MSTQSQNTRTRVNLTVTPRHYRMLEQIAEHMRVRNGRALEECIDIAHKSMKLPHLVDAQ